METRFRETCISLRKEGFTLAEIIQKTGRPKTSVYFHIKELPLSTPRLLAHRKASGQRIRKFALARKGKSSRRFSHFNTWTPENVLLIGHLLFDGEIRRGHCAYNNRSLALIERYEGLMRTIYDFPAKRYVNTVTGVVRSRYFNVELGAYLKEKAQELLEFIPRLSIDHKREFLRAFFDDEGCMTFTSNKKRQVRGYQKEREILDLIETLLKSFNITSHIQPPNEIIISGKDNLQKFQREINFSPGVRVNGKRANSVWRKSFEKRTLLDKAIKSFKT